MQQGASTPRSVQPGQRSAGLSWFCDLGVVRLTCRLAMVCNLLFLCLLSDKSSACGEFSSPEREEGRFSFQGLGVYDLDVMKFCWLCSASVQWCCTMPFSARTHRWGIMASPAKQEANRELAMGNSTRGASWRRGPAGGALWQVLRLTDVFLESGKLTSIHPDTQRVMAHPFCANFSLQLGEINKNDCRPVCHCCLLH